MSQSVLVAMSAASDAAHPREACGLLLGEGARITRAAEARNVHPKPETHFEIDPQALIDAHRDERGGGVKLIGYFHSHPAGEAVPSAIDRAAAAGDGKVWAIASGKEVRFWRDTGEGFVPLSYFVTNG